jgi:hypothetical protein
MDPAWITFMRANVPVEQFVRQRDVNLCIKIIKVQQEK